MANICGCHNQTFDNYINFRGNSFLFLSNLRSV